MPQKSHRCRKRRVGLVAEAVEQLHLLTAGRGAVGGERAAPQVTPCHARHEAHATASVAALTGAGRYMVPHPLVGRSPPPSPWSQPATVALVTATASTHRGLNSSQRWGPPYGRGRTIAPVQGQPQRTTATAGNGRPSSAGAAAEVPSRVPEGVARGPLSRNDSRSLQGEHGRLSVACRRSVLMGGSRVYAHRSGNTRDRPGTTRQSDAANLRSLTPAPLAARRSCTRIPRSGSPIEVPCLRPRASHVVPA